MAEPLDLTALRAEIEDHLGELPRNVTCCPGCRTALEDGPALLAEVERLRALVDVAVWCDCGIGASRDGLCDNSAIASMPHADDRPARDRALAAEVERLRAELAHAKHRLGQVTALYEAADPAHHAPADGTLVLVSRGDWERAYRRSDGTAMPPEDGNWWPVGGLHAEPYAAVVGHDNPPQDRTAVTVEAYVSLDDLRCALDGVL